MRVWIASVLVLYGMVEVYQWMKHFTLPLPVFILGGAFLAIASNYGKYAGWSFQQQPESDSQQGQIPPIEDFADSPHWTHLNPSSATPMPKPAKPLSFTIRPAAQKEVMNDERGASQIRKNTRMRSLINDGQD
jgi:hypothetical protein